MKSQKLKALGFSLIELMIALVAGLVVSGAAVAFMVSSLRSNNDYVQATKLEQELRSNLDFATRDLRRAGYDQDALSYINMPSSSTASSPFNRLLIATGNQCVIYAYDRFPGTPGQVDLANQEIRAFRRVSSALTVNGVAVGVLEFAESSTGRTPDCAAGNGANYSTYPPSCTASPLTGVSEWCAISDPQVLNITAFQVNSSASTSTSAMLVRDLSVSMTGSLIRSSDISRTVNTRVKVRADCLRASPTTACVVKPSGI